MSVFGGSKRVEKENQATTLQKQKKKENSSKHLSLPSAPPRDHELRPMDPLVSTSEAELGALGPPDEPSSSSHSRPRAPWTPTEHEVFLRALAAHGRDWRRVSAVLQEAAAGRGDCGAARSLAQVRARGGERAASGRSVRRSRSARGTEMRRRFSLFSVLRAEIFPWLARCGLASRLVFCAPLSHRFEEKGFDFIENGRDERGLTRALHGVDRERMHLSTKKGKKNSVPRSFLTDSEQRGNAREPQRAKQRFPFFCFFLALILSFFSLSC